VTVRAARGFAGFLGEAHDGEALALLLRAPSPAAPWSQWLSTVHHRGDYGCACTPL